MGIWTPVIINMLPFRTWANFQRYISSVLESFITGILGYFDTQFTNHHNGVSDSQRMLQPLATRVPKVTLKRVDAIFPSLKDTLVSFLCLCVEAKVLSCALHLRGCKSKYFLFPTFSVLHMYLFMLKWLHVFVMWLSVGYSGTGIVCLPHVKREGN
jgi:hypothetical protein